MTPGDNELSFFQWETEISVMSSEQKMMINIFLIMWLLNIDLPINKRVCDHINIKYK